MRRRLAVVLILVGLALLVWWPAPQEIVPSVVPVEAPRTRVEVEVEVEVPESAPEAPPPPDAAVREALDAIGEITGRVVVDCPIPDLPSPMNWRHATDDVCFLSVGRIRCAVHEPAGAVVFARDGEPLGALGWWTDASGETHCAPRELSEHDVVVRVLTSDGEPVAGAAVSADDGAAQAVTGPDGRATLVLPTPDPTRVVAIGGGTKSGIVVASPEREAELVLSGYDPTDTGFPAQVHLDRQGERRADALASLEATLEEAELSAEAIAVLESEIMSRTDASAP